MRMLPFRRFQRLQLFLLGAMTEPPLKEAKCLCCCAPFELSLEDLRVSCWHWVLWLTAPENQRVEIWLPFKSLRSYQMPRTTWWWRTPSSTWTMDLGSPSWRVMPRCPRSLHARRRGASVFFNDHQKVVEKWLELGAKRSGMGTFVEDGAKRSWFIQWLPASVRRIPRSLKRQKTRRRQILTVGNKNWQLASRQELKILDRTNRLSHFKIQRLTSAFPMIFVVLLFLCFCRYQHQHQCQAFHEAFFAQCQLMDQSIPSKLGQNPDDLG